MQKFKQANVNGTKDANLKISIVGAGLVSCSSFSIVNKKIINNCISAINYTK